MSFSPTQALGTQEEHLRVGLKSEPFIHGFFSFSDPKQKIKSGFLPKETENLLNK